MKFNKGVQTMFYDFEDVEIADEVLRKIEKDYGRTIARIPFFERAKEPNTFDIKVVFSDFRLLEAKIRVIPLFDLATIQVEGIYY
jgi:hypothetical protein